MINSEGERKTLDGLEADIAADAATKGGDAKLKELIADATAPSGVSEKRLQDMELAEFIGGMLLKLERIMSGIRQLGARLREDLVGTVNPLLDRCEQLLERLERLSESIAEKTAAKTAARLAALSAPKAAQPEKAKGPNYNILLGTIVILQVAILVFMAVLALK